MSRVLEYAKTVPWWIQQDALRTIFEIAARDHDISPEEIERVRGEPLDGTSRGHVRDGVAIIPVHGPIFRYANIFTRISGATSSEILALDISTAVADPHVRGIILEVDSPGGMVNGLAELSELIYRARSEKPINAFISGLGASAGYYIASSASKVFADKSSIVGSIGTVLEVVDFKKADEMEGVRTLEFVSSQSPKKRMDPFDEDPKKAKEAKSEIQELVDSLADVFIQDVARNRDVTVDTVLEDYGEGGVFVGHAAVEAGMADEVTTLEDLISKMSAQADEALGLIAPVGANTTASSEEDIMAEKKEAPAQAAPVVTVESVASEHAPIAEHFRAEGRAQGVEAERERIMGIHALPSAGFEELHAELMADPEATPGSAALRLLTAREERDKQSATAHLDALKADEEELGGPGPSASEPDLSTDEAQAAFILSAGKSPAQA